MKLPKNDEKQHKNSIPYHLLAILGIQNAPSQVTDWYIQLTIHFALSAGTNLVSTLKTNPTKGILSTCKKSEFPAFKLKYISGKYFKAMT